MQHTTDVHEMKRLTGIKTVAEVYRTLDKIAIRKEYHKALALQGIDLHTIIGGIKELCVNSNSDQVKLSGWKVFLRSLGLDEYKEASEASKGWEEKIKDIVQNEIDDNKNNNVKQIKTADYEVIVPKAPEEEIEKEKEEKKIGTNLYDE